MHLGGWLAHLCLGGGGGVNDVLTAMHVVYDARPWPADPPNVPLSSEALAVLAQLPLWDGCTYVVPNPKTKQNIKDTHIDEPTLMNMVNRCVRRAFLCGHDAVSGQSFEHRRGWIETRIRELTSVFTIDVAAYAVMSNHYHVVLRVDADRAAALSDDEVLAR